MKQPKKTSKRVEKDKRNEQIYKERCSLLSVEGSMATAVDQFLAKKYGLGRVQIWRICTKYSASTNA